MAPNAAPKTLQQAITFFADPANAHKFVVSMRWPHGVACPVCGSVNVSEFVTKTRRKDKATGEWKEQPARHLFQCREKHAKNQFSAKTGSIFEDSPIGLDKWLPAMWLIANCKNGISSYELGRALGVTQKTAWFMNHRIRTSMQEQGGGKLGGDVEIDETYIGAKARNMHKGKREKMRGRTWHGKVAVMGLLQRHPEKGKSKVRLAQVRDTRRWVLREVIDQHIAPKTEIFSDALKSYQDLGYADSPYYHHVIDHAEAYAKGAVHTNGMENFWSLLKRSIKGTYVSVEPFHLFRYLDEQAFRFNLRDGNDADRFVAVAKQVTGRRLTFDKLTARDHDL
jgi:transposase-like protein